MKKSKKKVTVAERAHKAGLSPNLVYVRVNKGWSLKKALTTPVRGRKSPTKKVASKKVVKRKPKVTKRSSKAVTPMVVEKYKSERPSNLIIFGLSTIIVLLITIIIGQ
jgi:hypothetical protein